MKFYCNCELDLANIQVVSSSQKAFAMFKTRSSALICIGNIYSELSHQWSAHSKHHTLSVFRRKGRCLLWAADFLHLSKTYRYHLGKCWFIPLAKKRFIHFWHELLEKMKGRFFNVKKNTSLAAQRQNSSSPKGRRQIANSPIPFRMIWSVSRLLAQIHLSYFFGPRSSEIYCLGWCKSV